MVSLAESSSNSPSISSNRRLGHSMRTFRPKLHRPEPFPSGELSDSIVDLHLHNLASADLLRPPDPSNDLLLLDLSQDDDADDDLSDLHSFSSDISGELRRLALAPSPSPSPLSPPPLPSPDLCNSLDNLEPLVLSDVSILTTSTDVDSKRSAAARLRLLAKHRSDFRSLIGSSGAISALVPLLRSPDPVSQEIAVTALLNLSLEDSNKRPIAAAGAIKPLVYALRTGTPAAKQNAACALLSLSLVEEHRATIGACGAIPPLVSLMMAGTSRGKKDALTTLYKLLSTRQNKERAVRAGAVAPLVGMVAEGEKGTAEKAMVLLGCLAGIPEGRVAIEDAGGIPVLVEAVEDGSVKGRELAVLALLHLCSEEGVYRAMLVREGVIPPLVALSQTGSARAKQKAETLLDHLREHRQDGGSAGGY